MIRLARSLLLVLALCGVSGVTDAQVSIPFPGPGMSTFTFATFDPATLTGGGSLSGGNLTYTSTGSASVVRATKTTTGKVYGEFTMTTGVSGSGNFGLGAIDNSQATSTPTSTATVTAKMWENRNDAISINNGSSAGYGSSFGATTIKVIAIDNSLGSGSGKIWVGVCSGGVITWPSSGNPATGANPMYSNLTGNITFFLNTFSSANFVVTANFGASAYSCTPPSGFGNL